MLRFPAPAHAQGVVEIRILEGDPSLFPGGDTGCVLWDAAEVLCRHLCTCSIADLVPLGGKALELGCGCGLTALVLGALGVEVVASDGDSQLLHGPTSANVGANAESLQAQVHTRVLRWGNECDDIALREAVLLPLGGICPSLVVGADLLYDSEGNTALALMLRRLAMLSMFEPGPFYVILAWTVRHPAAEADFVSSLEDLMQARQVHEEPVVDLFAESGKSVVRVVEFRLRT